MTRMDSLQRQAAGVEAKVLSSLKHPYIVRYWESFFHHQNLCIVMDYCEGGDLWKHIQDCRRKRASIEEIQVVRWSTQMCLALKYMHDRNILHRDIKTQNVFLTQKNGAQIVKIADFGISKVLGKGQAFARTVVGTPYYLSPEMCQKQPYAMPSDIWALGCVMFELCSMRVPFDAKDINGLVQKICSSAAPRIPPSYSRELADLNAEMLSRQPDRRPTAKDIIEKPLLQVEIKRMLVENRENEEREPARPKHAERASSRSGSRNPSPRPSPLGEHNRGPSPSPRRSECRSPSVGMRKPHSARSPSPQRGAAELVLRRPNAGAERHR